MITIIANTIAMIIFRHLHVHAKYFVIRAGDCNIDFSEILAPSLVSAKTPGLSSLKKSQFFHECLIDLFES